MKKAISILSILTSLASFGQCVVDAGFDKYVCVDKFGNTDSTAFDTEILQGAPPYQISWETEYLTGLQSTPILFASSFLNDTTLLKPEIVNSEIVPNNKSLKFRVSIIDNNGSNCTDSVNVYFSKFALLPDLLEREIIQGDTVQLYPIVGNGIPPLSYEWFPNYNISDTTSENPKVWPEVSTMYDVIISDSVGCISSWSATEWTINVKPVGIRDFSSVRELQLFPNPLNKESIIDLSLIKNAEVLTIIVFDNLGRRILVDEITEVHYPIGNKIKNSGNYIYQVYSKDQLIASGRFINLNSTLE